MPITPWGEADSLKDRRLRPGPGAPRAEVEQNQRERLHAATVAIVATTGYRETSVAELIAVAGVSRTTFYKYFADKEECYLATLDELLRMALAATEHAVATDAGLLQRAEKGLELFLELIVAQPDAARLCVVESYAAGPDAVRRVDDAMRRCREMMAATFERLPEQQGLPEEVLRGMIGSLRRLIFTRLRRRREAELPALVPQLLQLALAYQPPPHKLRTAWAGRSEGTAAGQGPRPARDSIERIELATMATVARKGFAEATIAEIAASAGVSLSTFYATFDGKREAFEAGLYRTQLQMFAAVLPRYRTARSWPEGIRTAILASLEFLEDEPTFAKLITVDVYAAGGVALEQRDLAIDSTERFIREAPGYEALGIDIAAEMIQNGIQSMLPQRVRTGNTRNLRKLAPLATYAALVPFLGPEGAGAVASGQPPPEDG